MKKIFYIIFILTGITVISSCYYDNFEEINPGARLTCDTSITVSFATNILPIMQSNCGTNNSACHNANGAGFWQLDNVAGIDAAIADGVFIESIKHIGTVSRMPKNSPKMDDCNIALIDKWLSTGKNP
jgi:hypothetical protein